MHRRYKSTELESKLPSAYQMRFPDAEINMFIAEQFILMLYWVAWLAIFFSVEK